MRCLFFAVFALCIILTNNLQNRSEKFDVFSNDLSDKTNVSVVKNVDAVPLNDEHKGRKCLKNVTKCIETGRERLFNKNASYNSRSNKIFGLELK